MATPSPEEMNSVVKDIVTKFSSKPKKQKKPTIYETDGIAVGIWKIMSDYKPYTANEVGLLLQDFGFNLHSVITRFSLLKSKNNWFSKKGSVEGSVQYILKKSIKMPDDTPVEKPTQVKKNKDKKTITSTPLVNIDITIKGKSFTVGEAEEITKGLLALGYGQKDAVDTTSSLIDVHIKIKKDVFTVPEVNELVTALMAAGFGK